MQESIAEEAAKEAATANVQVPSIYTTIEDLLIDYKKRTMSTSTGKTFEIESLIPENLLINIGSPIVQQFIVEPDTIPIENRIPVSSGQAERITDEVKRIVCQHVISITISTLPQAFCGDSVLSIDRLTPTEVREIFRSIIELSTGEAPTFQGPNQGSAEQPSDV